LLEKQSEDGQRQPTSLAKKRKKIKSFQMRALLFYFGIDRPTELLTVSHSVDKKEAAAGSQEAVLFSLSLANTQPELFGKNG
jgi:hypothetical protein